MKIKNGVILNGRPSTLFSKLNIKYKKTKNVYLQPSTQP